MKLTDHISIIWPGRPFTVVDGKIIFDDGGPVPTQAQLDVTRDEALSQFEKSGTQVSMTSIRLTLIDAGLYQQVTAAINGAPDATERLKTQTWWSTAKTVRRDHPLVEAIGAAVGQTPAQIDALFLAAHNLGV